ncbi:hypothetical protein T11_9688 [Trichinella zimbabwensis]|uniref:Uncharacterized protein n=1 Tax=Trichinella zimbabwensis TaxID=268475 RepID=A0A0V1HXK0_9BILA|nr:hypothetical protein T11_9688 [Trichinella zimbabwensis]
MYRNTFTRNVTRKYESFTNSIREMSKHFKQLISKWKIEVSADSISLKMLWAMQWEKMLSRFALIRSKQFIFLQRTDTHQFIN